jgi:hypothetical protein
MNYKHGRFTRNREKSTRRTTIGEVETIYCKTFGCGRKLKPTELLYGEYCFSCAATRNQKERERLKLSNPTSKYFVQKFHWSALNNLWEKIRYIEITLEAFIKYIDSEDYIADDSKVFYRYDIFVNSACVDTIYSYNASLYD